MKHKRRGLGVKEQARTLLKTPYAGLCPRLSDAEFSGLKADVKLRGVLDPLIVDDADNLLDGHHRYKIDPKAPTRVLAGVEKMSDAEKRAFVTARRTLRGNLSDEQNLELQETQKGIAWELNQEGKTQAEIGSMLARSQNRISEWLSEIVSSIGADNANTTPPVVKDNRRKITKEDREVIVEAAADGQTHEAVAANMKLSRSRVSQIVTQEAKKAEAKKGQAKIAARDTKPSAKKYDVLVIDPPWPMKKIVRDCRPNQVEFPYPTMKEPELAALKIPAKAKAHIWLWTTHRFLPMALRLLEEWKLRYVCTFVWHKPGGFQPVGLPQYNCEFALYARRGSPKFKSTKALKVCFEAPRGKHSEKPEAFYEMVRRVTAGQRLDMFNRRTIEGFDGWGQEAAP